MKKACSILLCLLMIFACIPAGMADDASDLPQTPAAYAASDFAKYAARMAIGEKHIAVIDANGAVSTGGDNTNGQCNVPADLTGVKVKAVAAGANHTLALTGDGHVFAWGSSTSDISKPISIPPEVQDVQGSIKLIAAGGTASAVVTNDNTVIVWGGQKKLATPPAGLGNIVAIAISTQVALTLDDEGNVSVWSNNKDCATMPEGLNGTVVAIAAGQMHWLALKKDGTVSITGPDSHIGQCQNIKNQTGVIAIAGGWQSAMALLEDGSVWGWGRRPLGLSTEDGVQQIRASAGIRAFNATVVGGVGDCPTICAMQKDGTIKVVAPSAFTYDSNIDQFNFLTLASENATLSDLSVAGYDLAPTFNAATTEYTVNIPNVASSVYMTATAADPAATLKINGAEATSGNAHTVDSLVVGDNPVAVEVTKNGTVKTYNLTIKRAETPPGNSADLSALAVSGYDLDKDFEAATTEYTANIPNDVTSVYITATTADSNATLKIKGEDISSGSAYTVKDLVVGNNQVTIAVTPQNGASKTYTLNIKRAGAGGFSQTPAEYAASTYAELAARMAAGANHAAVVLDDGTVQVWGQNIYSQLEVPAGAAGIKALAAGNAHTLALKKDGTVVAWGSNIGGQCDIPAQPAGVQAKAIAALGPVSAVLSTDNKITVWGYNMDNGRVLDLTGHPATSIALSDNYLLALCDDGTVLAWDRNNDYQLCEVPVDFSGNVVALKGGNGNALALKADGSVVSWGNDGYPVPAGLANARAIACGNDYSAALTADGNIIVWGADNYGLRTVPADLGKVQALVSGPTDIYALKEDGTVAAWGRNGNGQCNIPEGINLFNAVSINNRLGSLSVETAGGTPCSIYPQIGWEQSEGITDIDYQAQEVRITAQPYSSKASLEIGGVPATAGAAAVIDAQYLHVGDNPISIKVTAENGSQRSYILHIKRVSPDYALPQTPLAYRNSELFTNANRLSAGRDHSLALKKDGTVVGWGTSTSGEINMPARLKDVSAVVASGQFSEALKKDGTVVAWGNPDNGKCDIPADLRNIVQVCGTYALGQNGQVYTWGSNSAAPPAGLSDVAAIAGGLALKTDGTVMAWGNNTYGQCDVPAGLDHVVAIASSQSFRMALKADGTLVTWGKEPLQGRPFSHPDIHYVKAIAAGQYYAAALKWDGSLMVWGDYCEQNIDMGLPLALDQPLLAISGGDNHLLGLNQDGTVSAWNDHTSSASGSGCNVPVGLNLFSDDTAYSGPSPDIPQTPAAYAASDYARAAAKICTANSGLAVLNQDGTVHVAIGGNDRFNLSAVPAGLNDVTAIAGSHLNVMALKADGTVVVWGYNGDKQCEVPDNVKNVTAIASGQGFSSCCLALKDDGTVVAWGGNEYGECNVPTGLADVIAIAASNSHCLALKDDGTVVAWGDNTYGQCDVPAGLDNVARIYAGVNYSLVLKNDGTVVAWGSNKDAQDYIYTGNCDLPEGLTGVVDIRGTAALKNNGTVVVWGSNSNGRRNVPPGLHDVAAVYPTGMAIKTDGTVVNWSGYYDLSTLSQVLTISNNIIIFRDGSLKYIDDDSSSSFATVLKEMLSGLNVLSGYYLAINNVELLNPAGESITSVASPGSYSIQVSVGNNNAVPTAALTIIQVRGGAGATSTGGGRVLGCVAIPGEIPATGSAVSSDFTMPAGMSGTAYVDVFIWDGWDTMVPRTAANQGLSFTVGN